MFLNSSKLRVLTGLASLLAVSIACSMPFSGSAELPDDGPPVAVSKESAANFVTKVLEASQQAAVSQTVRITISQQEVTSALTYATDLAAFSQGDQLFEGLEQFDTQNLDGQDVPPELERLRQLSETLGGVGAGDGSQTSPLDLRLRLEEPQVYFLANGQMILRGYGRLSRWRLPLRVVLAPSIQQNEIEMDFVEGQLGALPLPPFLFDPLGGLLAQALTVGPDYARITELTISQGQLTFAGQVSLDNLPGN